MFVRAAHPIASMLIMFCSQASDVTIKTYVRGDIDLSSEYFDIYGTDGRQLGQNPLDTSTSIQCNGVYDVMSFTVSAATFNEWLLNYGEEVRITFDASFQVGGSVCAFQVNSSGILSCNYVWQRK